MPRALATSLALLLLAAGCRAVDLRNLEGTEWRAVRIVDIVVMPARPPLLTFSHGGAAGFVVCSTFSIQTVTIDATADPPHLRFDRLSTAGLPCADRRMQLLETAFFDALTRAEFIVIEQGRLVLKGAGGAIVFEQVLASS